MLRVLAAVGDDLIVGTHNGNVGVISRCIMQDEGLVESKELEMREAEPHREIYRIPIIPRERLSYHAYLNPDTAVKFDIEDVKLHLWRYGDFMIRVGYSRRTKTWVVAKP